MHELVGGKAANLARLTTGGFNVPAGFVVTTDAYRGFLTSSGVGVKIRAALAEVDFGAAGRLEEGAAGIRKLIVDAPILRALASLITASYGELGKDPYVAVRSSGSAEDLAEASFAGLHDTYLDIQGIDGVLDAIRRCWASMWTARAMSYRQTKGYDHLAVSIAVVVQVMVESQVSGVLFTANPINTANDELVINASWGLGEAIVGGITTPDEFTVKARAGRIIEKKLGAKSVQVIRNPDTGRGTVSVPVPEHLRAQFSLSDAQAAELSEIGKRIEAYYAGFPQDIEWGMVDGGFFILQARPITGAEFSWDAEVNQSVVGSEAEFFYPPRLQPDDPNYKVMSAEIEDDQLWGRALADEGWAGACTPLMFSWRGLTMNWGHTLVMDKAGFPHLGNRNKRLWYFCKGKAYFNVDQDRGYIVETTPPAFRPYMSARMPKDWREEVHSAPFDWMKWINMYVRYHTMWADQAIPWIKLTERFLATLKKEHDGLSPEQLRALPDDGLKAYIKRIFDLEVVYGDAVWSGLILFFRDAACLLDIMVCKFYTGNNENVRSDLMAGSPRRCATARENHELFEFAVRIRRSDALRRLFDGAQKAGDFFGRLDESADGQEFRKLYDDFVCRHGHRGHSDRDIYFLRRGESPEVDFRPLKAILSAETLVDPTTMEGKINERREAAKADVVANFLGQPFGSLKAEIFKLVHEYVHECIMARDEERHFLDRTAYSLKRGYTEIGRRLVERGILKGERDYFFLTQGELYSLLDGQAMTPLIQSKIDGRMRDFDRVNDKVVPVPLFVRRGLPSSLDKANYADGALRGTATSRGVVTGTARVIKTLAEIPRVRRGEILVVNATDPGWTPVFMLIKGIVLETGGMLAHGSLLAREYGFPAVQVEDAMLYIPDGATITVDGDHGVVSIVKTPAGEEPPPAT